MARPAAAEARANQVIDYVCGLRKTSRGEYAVVVGRVVDGRAVDWRAEPISQPLDHAALTLTMRLRAMVGDMP